MTAGEIDGGGSSGARSRFSSDAEWFDWLVIGATALLAGASVWIGSSVIRGVWDYILVSLGWAVVGAAWAVTVLWRTRDRIARFAGCALLVGSLVSLVTFGPITALMFAEPSDLVVVGVLVIAPIALVLLRQRPLYLVWLVAPVLVVLATATALSGVPGSMRFAAAEPALTQYVLNPVQGGPAPDDDRPIDVGGIPVFEVIREDSQVLLVTGFIGILADDPAGLAYSPGGPPVGVGSEHIAGPWYRWIPQHYVSD